MNITIIGSGNVGSALGYNLQKRRYAVTFGVRKPNSEKSINASDMVKDATFLPIEEACKNAKLIIVTTPPEAVLVLIPQLGDIRDKIIIDATNAVRTKPEPFPTAYHAIKALTKSEKIVKCFNTTGYENMINPVYPDGSAIDMFCAGDHQESKRTVQTLAKEMGFGECWDFGGDNKVELLEKLALSWINLAIMQGHGRGLAFKIMTR